MTNSPSPTLSPAERFALVAIAEVATPAGRLVPMPDGATVDAVARLVDSFGSGTLGGWRGLLRALDAAAIPLAGSRLSSLAPEPRARVLERLAQAEATFWLVRGVTAPIKIVMARSVGLEDALGVDAHRLSVSREHHRWEERIIDARTLTHDEVIETEVVIVGTGAGGGPMAKALAERGHAVVMLEEGGHFTRADFQGRALERQQKLYRGNGLTSTVGNTVIPVPMGRTVGGTTTVNSGTCYRIPESTHRRWQMENGLFDLGPGSLDAYYERVEAMLEVTEATPETLGGCADVIARGAEALGWEHGPLRRNAPGCDGQGVCCFGCPTDAKRSTNVSYVPKALERGAFVYAHAKVTEVIVEAGRAVGVIAKVGGPNGSARRLVVRARAVVLAAGTVHTPALLLRQGLANASGRVGHDLTIHPASYAWAEMDHDVRGWEAIPQGYSIDEFVDQGIRFEGAFLPLAMASGAMGQVGPRWTHMVEEFDKLACFGFMIAETSRGRVRLLGDEPRMTYVMNDEDVRRIVRGMGLLARVYLAGGAKVVYPGMQLFGELRDLADVERLEREGPATIRAHHLDLTAYHPLGTCRMGSDPRRSVIGPTQETWDVPGLFVCDGSAVPGPLGVNPQLTIMALSERAAAFVERRVEEGHAPRRVAPVGTVARFEETMSGMLQLEDGGVIDVSFTVKARGPASFATALREGGTFALTGTLDAEGLVEGVPCEGTLEMHPLRRTGTLVYDLAFEDADGTAYALHGEKHTRSALALLRGMTTLYTDLRADGALLGSGILTFDMKDLSDFLASFGVEDVDEAPVEVAAMEGPAPVEADVAVAAE
ncbi:MAG: GMC family oxidoreductase [Sandaracinaceae bacterium]